MIRVVGLNIFSLSNTKGVLPADSHKKLYFMANNEESVFKPNKAEMSAIIKRLPKNEKSAEKLAQQDIKQMLLQFNDLINNKGITTGEAYKEYMSGYSTLSKKAFDAMTPEQKNKSVMFQRKAIGLMKDLDKVGENNADFAVHSRLLKAQIQLSEDALKYCTAKNA